MFVKYLKDTFQALPILHIRFLFSVIKSFENRSTLDGSNYVIIRLHLNSSIFFICFLNYLSSIKSFFSSVTRYGEKLES